MPVPIGERCPGCGKAQVYLDTDGSGRLIEITVPCRCAHWRRIHGICRYCDRPVTGRPKVALYCDAHRKLAERQRQERYRAKHGAENARRYRERHGDRIRERARAYYRDDPEVRERRNAYKREWRRRNRDKVRAQKRRAAIRNPDRARQYIRRYREEVAAGLRTPKRAPRNERGERLCLTPGCRIVVTGRAKLCDACKRGYLPTEVQCAA